MLWTDVVLPHVRPLENGDVAGAIALLRSASLRELRDEKFLRQELLPEIGLHEDTVHEYPESLHPWCGMGIRSWQYPNQFAAFLTYLIGHDIRSYLEIGARYGGTFIILVEYVRRFCDLYRACALDIGTDPMLASYARQTAGIEYRIGDSHSSENRAFLGSAAWDLAFIDGDHSYNGCSTDFQSVKQRSKLITLHDIANDVCPGTVQMWREIRSVMPSARLFEAVDQYREVHEKTSRSFLGIGVVDFS